MSYNEMARRLAALEAAQDPDDRGLFGGAPEAWTRLAPWALAVHASGGWDAASAMVRRGERLLGDCPYEGNDAYPHVFPIWDIQQFFRGGTQTWPTLVEQQEVRWMIVECVSQLLATGETPATIKRWDTGRAVWEAIRTAILSEGEAA